MNQPNSAAALADLFPDEDYQFRLRFQRGTVAEFFGPAAGDASLFGERRHWLAENPGAYGALLSEGFPLLEEAIALGYSEKAISSGALSAIQQKADPLQQCLALGEVWAPDFLLVRSEGEELRLVGGCVCFPSSWSLTEKIGKPLELIHGVVPGLNPAIGPQIAAFLKKLKPGLTWLRANWGLSRSPELNQHPARKLPRLDSSVRLEEVWLRVEHQALVALPHSRGILFGIRITLHPLVEVKNDAIARQGLMRALVSMPEELACYKNLASGRSQLLTLLRG